MKRILAALFLVLFANQASAGLWACAGWDSDEYPDPFMLKSSSDGIFTMTDGEDEVYVLHPDYIKEFLVEKDEMTVIAHLIITKTGEVDKANALVLSQEGRSLELISIGNTLYRKYPYRNMSKTYCNRQ